MQFKASLLALEAIKHKYGIEECSPAYEEMKRDFYYYSKVQENMYEEWLSKIQGNQEEYF